MGSGSKELLGIEPLELRFPFETKKQISCSIHLTNRTDDYIAFKVKTTSPKKYCVRPNSCIVPPRSTSDVIGNAQFSYSFCKTWGYFPQTVIFFNKGSGNVVDEMKLKVSYVTPRSPSPAREGSEEGSSPRPSFSDGGNLNYQNMQTTRESDEPPLLSVTRSHKDPEELTSDSETSALISRLTGERNSAIQQNNKLREELSRMRREISKQNGGFPFVFVVVIALLGILLGYIMKR
ncbi:hypothetical protein ABZP36_007072 [Zizania latifolia]